jgi:hypothetical protein
VLAKLASHYAGLKVEVRSALLIDGEGIEIRGVTISDPQLAGPAAELAYFDEIVLTCPTELAEFLNGEPEVKHVLVRRPRIRATRLPDGRWSAARLLPCPKFGKRRREMTIENGVVEFVDATRPQPATFTLREVHVKLHPLVEQSTDGDEPVRFEATLAGDHFQRTRLAGRIEAGGAGFFVERGSIERLDISPELLQALPKDISAPLAALASLRATCDLTGLSVVYQPQQPAPWRFSVAGNISRGRYDDPRLPQPLTELAAEFAADNRGIFVKQLTGKLGQSSIRLFGQYLGFTRGCPMFVEFEARQLLIGRMWEDLLNPQLRERWQKIQPAGEIDALVRLSFDGRQWQPEVEITCHNVSFTYEKFQYRVDRSQGKVTLKDNRLAIDLWAKAGAKDIRIEGAIDNPGASFTGELVVWGKDLAIEPRVIDALPAKPREIVRSLNPAGFFTFFMRVGRDDPAQPRLNQNLTLDLKHCSIRYDKFAYPIGNISGMVKMENGYWSSDDLRGTNDAGSIACRARLQPTSAGPELTLRFDGREIALEEELREALPPGVQQVWNDLRPRGSVNLGVDVHYVTGATKPAIGVTIEPAGDAVSIEPTRFPYRLERLQGALSYRDGVVRFNPVTAIHGRTKFSAEGYCSADSLGQWKLRFDRVTADRLLADGDLLAALPPRLKEIVAKLSPTGPINLDGKFELAGSGNTDEPLKSAWNINLDILQSSINAGVPLENVSGIVHLEGDYDGRQVRSAGELTIDSLSFKGHQFTELRGPLWVDDKQLILGSQAERPLPGRAPRRMTAKLYGGTVLADLWVGFGEPPRYLLRATLSDGDLERFAREQLAGRQRLKGKAGAGLVLGGAGTSLHQMEGQGEIWLREADIYQLPLMVALLKILSIRTPDTTAFTTSDVEFRVAGEHIYLDKLEFSGDAISLLGAGETNLNGDIRAILSAIVGRSEWQLPVIKAVMGQASQQIMQIHVDGSLSDPHVHREAFPGINQAIEQLQAGMRQRPQPLPQAARPGTGRR